MGGVLKNRKITVQKNDSKIRILERCQFSNLRNWREVRSSRGGADRTAPTGASSGTEDQKGIGWKRRGTVARWVSHGARRPIAGAYRTLGALRREREWRKGTAVRSIEEGIR